MYVIRIHNELSVSVSVHFYNSIDWQMIFNTDKCKVVHFGYNNTAADYSLGDVNIQSVKKERTWG